MLELAGESVIVSAPPTARARAPAAAAPAAATAISPEQVNDMLELELPVYRCRRATGPIAIDGRLDDPAWAGAETTRPFLLFDGSRAADRKN